MARPRRCAALLALGIGVAASAAAAGPLTSREIRLVDRLTWGITPSLAAQVGAIGFEAWLDGQLADAPAPLPAPVQDRIAALAVTQTPMAALAVDLDARSRAANQIPDPEAKKAAQRDVQAAMSDVARGSASRSILRALYAPDQVRERLTWFWFNRFNVHQQKANLRLMVGDYEERAIRPRVLGRFRDLLGATARHPAMLRYLDNADNAAGHLNENYARELMELHTLGVGSGYAQRDVEELARILTGLGIDLRPDDPRLRPDLQPQLVRDGIFQFNPARHDYVDKVFLGHVVRGRGIAELDEALDILAAHPATALRASRDLAVYFLDDVPPDLLVRRMAAEFTRTDGSIAAVLRLLFRSPEFRAAEPGRIKDPVRYVYSAVRLAYDDRIILNTGPVQNWLNRLSEGLFNHDTPDGYPLASAAWSGPGQVTARFEIARQIGSGPAGLFRSDEAGGTERPAFPLIQNGLYFNLLRDNLLPATRAALDQAVSPQDWNTLFLSSPDFMR